MITILYLLMLFLDIVLIRAKTSFVKYGIFVQYYWLKSSIVSKDYVLLTSEEDMCNKSQKLIFKTAHFQNSQF